MTPALGDSGEIRGHDASAPAIGAPFAGADNIAGVVGTVLTDDCHAGRPNEAARVRTSSFHEAVEQLAEATGRRIRYLRVSTERCAALLADDDVPDEVVVRLMRVLATSLDGGNARPTPGGERAIGRRPANFADCTRPASSARVLEERLACSRSLSG